MASLRKYAVTLKNGHSLTVEAEGFNSTMLPGWIVFTVNGKGYQAVANHAVADGPKEMPEQCADPVTTAVLADLLLKENDAPVQSR